MPKLPKQFHSILLKLFIKSWCDQPVAFFRSPSSQALFNNVKKYAEAKERMISTIEDVDEKMDSDVQEYRKCVIINHLLAYNNIRFGRKRAGLLDRLFVDSYHEWKEKELPR